MSDERLLEELHKLTVKAWDAWQQAPDDLLAYRDVCAIAWVLAEIRKQLESRLKIIPDALRKRTVPQ